jgi:prophage regulatory protein
MEVQSLLRLRDVLRLRARGKTAHYADISRELFTDPVLIGDRAVAWPASEVEAVNAARIAGKTDDDIRELVRRLMVARKTAFDAMTALKRGE